MINTDAVNLMDAIAELHRCYPNWRIGQLLANLAGWADQDIWDAEDDQLLAAARLHLKECESAGAAVSNSTSLRSKAVS